MGGDKISNSFFSMPDLFLRSTADAESKPAYQEKMNVPPSPPPPSSCSQHSDSVHDESRTSNPSIPSLIIYHLSHLRSADKGSVIFLPANPASFAHNFCSGMQSYYFSESQDAMVLQTCHVK